MTRTAAEKRHFALRKIHSLTGLVPIGGYLLFHLFENGQILLSAERFEAQVAFIEGFGWMILPVEILLLGSLLFHGVYGFFIVQDARPNLVSWPRARNWQYFFQRVTGVVAFFFIGWHVWQTRAQYYMGHYGFIEAVHVSAEWMAQNIWGATGQNWITATAYLVGVVASVLHLTNGLFNMGISWGITVGHRAQAASFAIFTGLGIALSAFGIAIAVGFRPHV